MRTLVKWRLPPVLAAGTLLELLLHPAGLQPLPPAKVVPILLSTEKPAGVVAVLVQPVKRPVWDRQAILLVVQLNRPAVMARLLPRAPDLELQATALVMPTPLELTIRRELDRTETVQLFPLNI